MKNAEQLSVFSKHDSHDSHRLSNFLHTHIFETSIIFLGLTIKLITGAFDLQQ